MAYQIFSEIIKTHKTVGIDEIVEVGKSVDEIVEVEKFNPFHDDKGWFATSNGFKSYSADPNTKAGAMAISRSVAAGHGSTKNVNRNSSQQDLDTDANQMKRGNGSSNLSGSKILQSKVERRFGLAGANVAGAQWQAANAARGKTIQSVASKPATQKPATAKKPAAQQQDAQNPASTATQQTSGSGIVDGKDITSTVKIDLNSTKGVAQQIAEQQGFTGKPQVVSKAAFDKATEASGIQGYRTWHEGRDVATGQFKTGSDYANETKSGANVQLNGSGGQCYGPGMYIATNRGATAGTKPSATATASAKRDSKHYGHGRGMDATLTMTLDKSAKIVDWDQSIMDFQKLPNKTKAKYGCSSKSYNNTWADSFIAACGAWNIARGYDAAVSKNAGCGCDYTMVYNFTKLIISK